ncbi:hypothetical protein BOTBODRAFT_28423 [Botryobasidium botryosum FD-172 SS1]|uniref:Uncharacterized protein n=1 Tax=Botryobasidium botryosum (strain FD-172 SS1) TaxID=930990 RepID=A0A067MTM5_BOTB1|nr:hypothetical protein BOTBODRAFT_28423 [Botryobasidium botryosum FD-172 SS1]
MGGRQHLDVNQGRGLLIGVLARCVWLQRDAAGGRGFWHTAGWDFGFILHSLYFNSKFAVLVFSSDTG